jgi:hypothetical protein
MEEFLILSIFLNILALAVVLVMWLFYNQTEQEEANEVETEIPPKGRIVLKKDGQIMYGVPYEGVYDFDNVHSEVFVQLLQRKKDGGNWVIEVVPF